MPRIHTGFVIAAVENIKDEKEKAIVQLIRKAVRWHTPASWFANKEPSVAMIQFSLPWPTFFRACLEYLTPKPLLNWLFAKIKSTASRTKEGFLGTIRLGCKRLTTMQTYEMDFEYGNLLQSCGVPTKRVCMATPVGQGFRPSPSHTRYKYTI